MQRKLWVTLFLLVLVPALSIAQSGKIRGTVVDAKTKEPLIGANVVIEASNMGASSDVDGAYIILNVPVGTYQLKVSYVGFQTITVSNVRVNANLTTEQNFQLSSQDVQVQAVEIVAERPLINKSATGAVRVIDNEFFSKLPSRGLNAAVTLQPGVVQLGGNFYIRGGRPDEAGFTLEGVNVTDVMNGGRAINITAEALEQVQVLTGGWTAEYGGATAGLVRSELRTGTERLKASALIETDDYTSQGNKSLGGYSYGYRDITATVSGPVLSNSVRFFGSLQNTFYQDPAVRVWDGYSFKNVVMSPAYTHAHPTAATRDTVNLIGQPGNTQGGEDYRTTGTATLKFDISSRLQVRAGGSYSAHTGTGTTTTANIFNLKRLGKYDNSDGFANLKATYFVTPTTYVTGQASYTFAKTRNYDPDFGDNLKLYGDSLANARLGYYLYNEGLNFSAYRIHLGTVDGITELPGFNQPGTQINGYGKTSLTQLSGRLDFVSQISKTFELKVGGEGQLYTYRQFNPARVIAWAAAFKSNGANMSPTGSLAQILRGYGPNNIGYDVFGNEIDNNVETVGTLLDLRPRQPMFGGAYVQSKIEMQDIILNLGLRYDYISADIVQWSNPGKLTFNDTLGAIRIANLETTPVHSYLSPRIGFSFPVTDRTQFYAQYGRFVQESRLFESYAGSAAFYNIIKGGYFYQNPIGFGIRPEQTTMYEIGFQQQLGDNASFDIVAFYKDVIDQLQYTSVIPAADANQQAYYSYQNGDFATTKGLEFKFTLRRVNRLQAAVNYTLSDARGTGSTPSANSGAVASPLGGGVFLPHYIVPLDFNQAHHGNISLDYRYGKNDGGPVLQQLGLNVLAQFNSGTSFTRVTYNSAANPGDPRFRIPVEEMGSSTTPWFFQIDARLDKSFTVGPVDLNVYVYVINLLGTDNATAVFSRSGDPKDDGWFAQAEGRNRAASFGTDADLYRQMYTTFNGGRNAANFGPPRQIRFGVKVDY